MKKNYTPHIVGGVIGLILVIALLMKLSYDSSEGSLRNQIKTEQDVAMLTFDTMWKTIQGKAQVADKYRETFEKVYPQIMDARYKDSSSQTLMKFVMESNPNYDPSILRDLANTIEGKRDEFMLQQKKLRDLKREHDNLRTVLPACWFEGGRSEIKITLVESQSTKDTYDNGGIEKDQPIFPSNTK